MFGKRWRVVIVRVGGRAKESSPNGAPPHAARIVTRTATNNVGERATSVRAME